MQDGGNRTYLTEPSPRKNCRVGCQLKNEQERNDAQFSDLKYLPLLSNGFDPPPSILIGIGLLAPVIDCVRNTSSSLEKSKTHDARMC